MGKGESMISVRGAGWLTKTGYGCLRCGLDYRFEQDEGVHSLAKRGVFTHPFKNFGRLDTASRMTVSAIALALQDADVDYSPSEKQDIGIIASSCEGSLQSDINYFRDFVENGRTLSRANLFIYTLPSSAPGEAAIHFGLTGPLMFMTASDGTLSTCMDMAAEMVAAGETGSMLVGTIVQDEAVYFVIDRSERESSLCSIAEVCSIAASTRGIPEILCQLSILLSRKGIA
jgi:3-oxoacyl-[acyl-carrier-protein] synthase II